MFYDGANTLKIALADFFCLFLLLFCTIHDFINIADIYFGQSNLFVFALRGKCDRRMDMRWLLNENYSKYC